MARMILGCVMAAITSARPPHGSHNRTSDANTRAINFAQQRRRWRREKPAPSDWAAGSGPATVGGVERSRITASRHFDPGAKTPWYRSALLRGQGTKTAIFSISSVGSNATCVVPSRHGCRSRYAIRPSGSSRSRSLAIGGREMYLHSRSSRLRSPASTATPACKLKPCTLAQR